jgi:hypothetical protein
MVQSDSNELNCTKLVFPRLNGFIELNNIDLQEIATQKPIICFIEKRDEKFENSLRSIANKTGAPFYTISTIEEAKQHREALKESRTGILVIDTMFSRGFDLKMAQDGFGIVVANGTGL